MKKLIFRVDAGHKIGFGHLKRSISLANLIRDKYNIEILFLSNPYNLLEKMLESNNFEYQLNTGYDEENFLRSIGDRYYNSIFFIDKIFNYSSELIRDIKKNNKVIMFHNQCPGMFESDYSIFPVAHLDDVTIKTSKDMMGDNFLHGPEYIIINQEILNLKKNKATKNHLSLTTGASDDQGLLLKLINLIEESGLDIQVKALFGFDFSHKKKLDNILPTYKSNITVKEFNYEDLFSSKLVVSSFGVTPYEVIYNEIPVLTFGHKSKNAFASKVLHDRYGCNFNLGFFGDINESSFVDTVGKFWNNKHLREKMKSNQKGLIDGRGLIRTGDIIYKIYNES